MTIRDEADELLSSGLHGLLADYGEVLPTGSYYLNLMTWRDLDLYLLNESLPESGFFELGLRLEEYLQPVKMSYRNERRGLTVGLPHGLYWGVYLGDERKDAWKIDIWCVPPEEAARLHSSCVELSAKLTPDLRKKILAIKEKCWRNPNYRKGFGSVDIYEAVVDRYITSFEGFREWMNNKHSMAVLLSDPARTTHRSALSQFYRRWRRHLSSGWC